MEGAHDAVAPQDPVAPLTVRIASADHRVRVIAEPGAELAVVGDAAVEHAHDETTIVALGRLRVTVPAGADLVIGTTTGRVQVVGPVGRVAAVSETGRIDIDEADSVDARTTSGSVRVGRVAGECTVRTSSGRVGVGSCGPTDVATESGRVSIDEVDGPARVHCVSGRINIGLATANDVDAESVSGRIEVTVPSDVRVHRAEFSDESGERPVGTDCTVAARSISGRVAVVRR